MHSIILVDDEYYFRSSLRKNFDWEGTGFEVVGDANNGNKAYELIKEKDPRVALLDINMPGINGIDLLERLSREGVKCKCIFLTGYDDFEYAQKAVKFGAYDYLLKPVEFEELETSLKRVSALLCEQAVGEDLLIPEKPEVDSFEEKGCDIASKVTEYIDKNYQNKELSVTEISKHCFLNYSYLCCAFKKEKGMTINAYIQEVRLNKAKEFFNSGCYNIAMVAEKLGFDNANYFSKWFKKSTGITPTEYIGK